MWDVSGIELHLWTEIAGPMLFQISLYLEYYDIFIINEKDVTYPTSFVFLDICVLHLQHKLQYEGIINVFINLLYL